MVTTPAQIVSDVVFAVDSALAHVLPPQFGVPASIQSELIAQVKVLALEGLEATEATLQSNIIANGSQAIGAAIGTALGTAVGASLVPGMGAVLGADVGAMIGGTAGHLIGATIQSTLGPLVLAAEHDVTAHAPHGKRKR